ncbi:MAG TPA: hypothetical protein VGM25_10100 [Caulobacteraceae bacterium]
MTRHIAAPSFLLLAAFLLAATAPAAHAQTPDVPINAQTQIFCRDNTGTPVLQTYSNWGAVMRRYADRFHFDMSIQSGQPEQVVFSNPAETPYSITYTVEPYRDPAGRSGILLDKMHLFLDNADRDVDGVPMCYFTEYGK